MKNVNNEDDFVRFQFRIEHTVFTITIMIALTAIDMTKLKIQNFETLEWINSLFWLPLIGEILGVPVLFASNF